MEQEKKSRRGTEKLDSLEKKLYKKGQKFSYRRQKLERGEAPEDIKSEWRDTRKERASRATIRSSYLVKLFVLSLIFFLLAIGIAFYQLVIKPGGFDPDKIQVLVKAPTSIEGGDEVPIQVTVRNTNVVAMEDVKLAVQFPEGAIPPGGAEEGGQYMYRENLGVILPKQEVRSAFSAIIYGGESAEKAFDISLEYRVEGSNAVYEKKRDPYLATISKSPVTLSVDIPPEVNAGEEISFEIGVASNINTELEEVLLVLDYPFGFQFKGAEPDADHENRVWQLGDLMPSAERRITVRGVIEGLADDEKAFKISVGTQSKAEAPRIEVPFNELTRVLTIRRPFVGIDLAINGNASGEPVVIKSGEPVEASFSWRNNLSNEILNGEIRVTVSGPVVDKRTIVTDGGFYRSLDDVMIWNQTTDRTLSVLEPQESGSAQFSFKTNRPYSATSVIKNPEITINLEFVGERVAPGFANEEVRLSLERMVRVATDVQLASYGLHHAGPFENTGPIPPRVNEETTYTVVWSLTNSSSDVEDAVVYASLPIYMRWMNVVSPAGEDVFYNEQTGEIRWTVGDLPAGTGITSPAREVMFQVGFTPSSSQVGSEPPLVSSARVTGADVYTDVSVESVTPTIDTGLPQDPQIRGKSDATVRR